MTLSCYLFCTSFNIFNPFMHVFHLALQATLLVLHPDTGKLMVNFDPKISEIIRETKCMQKMGLVVPEQALRLVKNEKSIMASRLRLEV